MEQKLISNINELTSLITIFIEELYASLKKIDCNAQTMPISNIRKDPWPNIVNKKSEIFAPSGPPKLLIAKEDVLLKKAGSLESYETSAIKMYREKAIKKKLKNFNNVFFT